jgi:hypothetical protein
MNYLALFKRLSIFFFILVVHSSLMAAQPCKGPNRNDPGCPGAELEPPPPPVVVDSVTVDWLNEKLVVRGSGFTGSTSFLLGSNATPLATAGVTDTELDIPFSSVMASEVLSEGNYKLEIDGSMELSVYVESQIIDPGASGCPCQADWSAELGSLWGPENSECLEVVGLLTNDPADIAGTVLTDFTDASVYPHYPIGASFIPGDPDNSVCRLVQVNGDASVDELVNHRINETQQEDCALLLRANICLP